MKLPYTNVKFYPEVKCQTGLSSLRVLCKRALRKLSRTNNFVIKSDIRSTILEINNDKKVVIVKTFLINRYLINFHGEFTSFLSISKVKLFILTLEAPTPQNGQTHSNNSSPADELIECV